jgi:3-oxoacyl-[acyl-carrier protein] reductase
VELLYGQQSHLFKELFAGVRRKHGKLDALINNAGVASMNHAMLTPISTLKEILDINVVGTFLFAREGAKLMQRGKMGRIINFSSVAVPLKLQGEAAYAASKAAVNTLTQILAREFSDSAITVNAIGPTPVETDLISKVSPSKLYSCSC